MNMSLRGGCACGEVKYVINASPLFTQACHYILIKEACDLSD